MNNLPERQRKLHEQMLAFMAERSGPFGYAHENRVPVLRIEPSRDGHYWPAKEWEHYAPFRYSLDALHRVEMLLYPDELTRYCDLLRQQCLDVSPNCYLQRAMTAPPELRFTCLCVVLGFVKREETMLDVREAGDVSEERARADGELNPDLLPPLTDNFKAAIRSLALRSIDTDKDWSKTVEYAELLDSLSPNVLLSLLDDIERHKRARAGASANAPMSAEVTPHHDAHFEARGGVHA